MARHPLAQKLYELHQRRNATVAELKATLEMAQLEVERCYDQGLFPRVPGPTKCAQPGCNYRKYPASRFCMYHVTGSDTFAARLRRLEAQR